MPKPTKTKIEVAETPVVTAPVSSSATPTADKPKQSKPRAPKAPKADAPVVESVVVESTTTTEDAAPDADELTTKTSAFLTRLNDVSSSVASLKTEFKNLEKQWSRQLKTAQKSQAKRKRKTGNRQPSGFVKPTKISEELAAFLGKEKGTEMARTDVTKEINGYIKLHKLQDAENGRRIHPDARLQKLLKLQKGQELTYFNLQKYMSVHFAKAEKKTATA
jgi:chromatin remodeling complex protein RSC6